MSRKPPKPQDRSASPRFRERGKAPKPAKYRPLGEHQSAVAVVSQAHERLIGAVVVAFSKIEAAVQDMIWRLLGVSEDDGRIVTCRNDVEENLTSLRALAARHMSSGQQSRLAATITEIKATREHRNFVVHAAWGTLMPEGVPIGASVRKNMEQGLVHAQTYPPELMMDIIATIAKSIRELVAIRTELGATSNPTRPPHNEPGPTRA